MSVANWSNGKVKIEAKECAKLKIIECNDIICSRVASFHHCRFEAGWLIGMSLRGCAAPCERVSNVVCNRLATDGERKTLNHSGHADRLRTIAEWLIDKHMLRDVVERLIIEATKIHPIKS